MKGDKMDRQRKFQLWFDTMICGSVVPKSFAKLAKSAAQNANDTLGRGILRKADDGLANAKGDIEWLNIFVGSFVTVVLDAPETIREYSIKLLDQYGIKV